VDKGGGWATGKSRLSNGKRRFLTHQSPFITRQPLHVHHPWSKPSTKSWPPSLVLTGCSQRRTRLLVVLCGRFRGTLVDIEST
jgi:hypothetical protein